MEFLKRKSHIAPDLSVIIVTYNSAKEIKPCLDSIERTKGNLNIEIFLVDNNSRDNTAEIVCTQYPNVHLIVNNYNTGFPAANNQALAHIQSNLILLLNPDTILCENALINLVNFLNNINEAVVVGLNIRNRDGSFQFCIRRLPNLKYILFSISGLDSLIPRSAFFNGFRYCNIEPTQIEKVGCVSGAALAFNRQTLAILKELDMELFYYEDIDFCARAWDKGIFVYFLPNSRVIHLGGRSEISNKERAIFQITVSRINYFKKHHSLMTFFIVRFITAIELFFRLFIRILQSCIYGSFNILRPRICAYIYALSYILFGKKPTFK